MGLYPAETRDSQSCQLLAAKSFLPAAEIGKLLQEHDFDHLVETTNELHAKGGWFAESPKKFV